MSETGNGQKGVKELVNTLVLKSSGTGFGWCINQYDGCAHGCKYCYGMTIRRKRYDDWIKAKPRKDVTTKLKKDIEKIRKNNVEIRDIFVGSICDSYQALEAECSLTRQVLEILIKNELPFTVLTKSHMVLRDIDLFKNYELCRVGVTITSLHEQLKKDLEPGSASYEKRIEVLKTLKANGISTYLSCEPIFPVKEADPTGIVAKLRQSVDLFEFGMWNKYRTQGIPEYYYREYSDDYYRAVFKSVISFCEQEEINYCIASHSRKFVEECGLRFKPYPLVKA